MSHCEVIELPELQLESYQINEVLKILSHTIIFNRSLSQVKPIELDSELFDITWVSNGDKSVDKKIEQKISHIQAWAEHNPGKHLDITLSFYEQRQHQGWFAHQEQRIYWEQWHIYLTILPSDTSLLEHHALEANAARAARTQSLQSVLEECLFHIVTAVDSKRDHLPPVVSGSPLTYPFDIKFIESSNRILSTTSSGGGGGHNTERASSSSSRNNNNNNSTTTTTTNTGSPSVFGFDFVRRILSSSSPPSVLH